MSNIVIAALYQFKTLHNLESKKSLLTNFCRQQKIKGTLILAEEGINGTVAGTREAINKLQCYLKEELGIDGAEYKESFEHSQPFYRLKIKIKSEIVTIGQDNINPCMLVGQYIEPEAWNAVIEDPEVIVIDTRNDYEYELGSFKNAINPQTDTFREFPEYIDQHFSPSKHKKVAMFCTGGIRCEKASSLMLNKGFDTVYHLKGGILNYLEKVPKSESLWQGECFVFDNRVAVNHDLETGSYELCHGCRMPINEQDKQSVDFVPGVSCPKCAANLTEEQKQRFAERQKQMELARQRNQQHIGSKE